MEPQDALLTDRVAIVTGAAVGIGRAVATSLAAFGARVAVCDRDADNLATVGAAHTGVLDVRDTPAVDAFVTCKTPENGGDNIIERLRKYLMKFNGLAQHKKAPADRPPFNGRTGPNAATWDRISRAR